MGPAMKPDFAAAIDALELFIIFLTADGGIAGFNSAAARLVGLTPSDVVARSGRSTRWPAWSPISRSSTDHVTAGGAAVQRGSGPSTGRGSCFEPRPIAAPTGTSPASFSRSRTSPLFAPASNRRYTNVNTRRRSSTRSSTLSSSLTAALRVQTANKAFHSAFELSRDDVQGTVLRNLGKGEWDIPQLLEWLQGAFVAGSDEIEPLEVDLAVPTRGRRTVIFTARKLSRADRRADLLLLTAEDITDRRRAERAIRERTAQFEILLNEAPWASISWMTSSGSGQ